MTVLLLDHDDSFVHTLAAYVAELGHAPTVMRASATSAAEIIESAPSHVILSPGPRTPSDCPVAVALLHSGTLRAPVLGVCLGHQCIAAAFGARVERSAHPQHGSASTIRHDARGVLSGLASPFAAARYHSLAVVAESVPSQLEITAWADDGEVMGIRHRERPIEGVQFHPESILTEHGHQLLANFLRQ